jgi:hypothetical protein
MQDVETHMGLIDQETSELRTILRAVRSQQDLTDAHAWQVTDVTMALTRLANYPAEIESRRTMSRPNGRPSSYL